MVRSTELSRKGALRSVLNSIKLSYATLHVDIYLSGIILFDEVKNKPPSKDVVLISRSRT